MLKLKVITSVLLLAICVQLTYQENWFKLKLQTTTTAETNKKPNDTEQLKPLKTEDTPTKLNVTSRQFIPNRPAVSVVQNVSPVKPFLIQQPVVSWTGEVVIENSIGGIPFDCSMRPTGHWRDANFCDIFHACVWGNQKKTYLCPIVGERTYFDEVTQRCEFVHLNPSVCMNSPLPL